jgi:hypothetical protein
VLAIAFSCSLAANVQRALEVNDRKYINTPRTNTMELMGHDSIVYGMIWMC